MLIDETMTNLDSITHNGKKVADKILCWGHLLVHGTIRATNPLEHIPGDDYDCEDCDFFVNCPAVIRNE